MNTQIDIPNFKSLPSLPDSVVQSTRRAWLASLGTVSIVGESTSRLVESLGERGRALETKRKKSVDVLVDRGTEFEKKIETQSKRFGKEAKKIEREAKESVDKAIHQAETTLESLQNQVDSRLSKVTERLGLPNRDQIRTLSNRVEELTRKVEAFHKGPIATSSPAVFQLVASDSGWALKGAASGTVISEHPTKDKGLVAGRKLAQAQEPSELIVFKLDGEIQATYSYGDE